MNTEVFHERPIKLRNTVTYLSVMNAVRKITGANKFEKYSLLFLNVIVPLPHTIQMTDLADSYRTYRGQLIL